MFAPGKEMPKKTLRIPYKPSPPRKCRDCGREVRKPDLREGRARQLDADTFVCPFCVLTTAGPLINKEPAQSERTDPLREIKNARQITGEPTRKWYTNVDIDLIVWMEEPRILGYQLVVPSEHGHTAITWREGSGLSVSHVDDGEGRPARPKMTPLLTGRASINVETVLQLFRKIADDLPHGLASLVEQTLLDSESMKKASNLKDDHEQ